MGGGGGEGEDLMSNMSYYVDGIHASCALDILSPSKHPCTTCNIYRDVLFAQKDICAKKLSFYDMLHVHILPDLHNMLFIQHASFIPHAFVY